MSLDELHAELLTLLLADYGLDAARGGMGRSLTRFLRRRLAELELEPSAYLERVRADVEDEREELIHWVTVTHSWFFRDADQIAELGEHLQAGSWTAERPAQLWVTGCASGEEAWTFAFLGAELGCPVRVLATDVDALALSEARAGVYRGWALRDLPEPLRRFVEPCGNDRWRVVDAIRPQVEFAVHNLCEPPLSPQSSPAWDVISCRNVLIYFEQDRARSIVAGLRDKLALGGRLFLGSGDLVHRLDEIDANLRASPGPQPRLARVDRVEVRMASPTPREPRAPARPSPPKLPDPVIRRAPPERAAEPAPKPEPKPKPEDASDLAVRPSEVVLEQLCRIGEAVEAGETEQARALLEGLLRADPTLAEGLLWLGLAHHLEGDAPAAAEALRRARCMEPELWPATLFAALNAERLGRWSKAARCWSDLDRALDSGAPPIPAPSRALAQVLPRWRAEALDLVRQRRDQDRRTSSDS